MSRETYKDIKFSRPTLEAIYHVNEIIEEYARQGFRMTLRQIYYQLVARDLFPDDRTWTMVGTRWVKDEHGTKNADPNYNWLGSIINEAKIAGYLDWDAIEDRHREFVSRPRWDSPRQIVEAVSQQYHIDLWVGQPYRAFLIVEKDALVGMFEQACREYDVPLLAAKGYPSGTVLREFAKRDLLPAFDAGQEPVIIHFGDHDPSGIDMTRDLEDRIEMFCDGTRVRVDRWALNMDQIRRYKPPPNPAKVTDSRAGSYISTYGASSWELDALQPTVLDNLARTAFDELIDTRIWKRRLFKLGIERKKIEAIVDQL